MDTSGSRQEGSNSRVRAAATEEQEFLGWLRRHGAAFGGVNWPSSETESGIRGAVATRNIDSGDHMVVIPHALMMSEFHAKADPDLGHVHRLNPRLLDNDNGLAVYIMQETLKEDKSFYRPYLRVLPTPHNLRSWNGESLLLLQDNKLVRRTAATSRKLLALYSKTIGFLSNTYPKLYAADRYTFELFEFAWSTVQARAFGKRLKSSALVPFADCLNHGSVQTKYDFDVEGNGTFRLFPSGTNRYARGAEVLNSYGRRPNDNLLLDYGFAMLDNEWDTAEVVCSLAPSDQTLLDRRRNAYLRSSGQHTVRIFRVRRDVWSAELLRFCRCTCLTAAELDSLEAAAAEAEAAAEQQATTPPPQSSPADLLHRKRSPSGDDPGGFKPAAARATTAHGGVCPCAPRSSSVEVPGNQGKSDGSGSSSRAQRAVVAAGAAAHPLSVSREIREDSSNVNGPLFQENPQGGVKKNTLLQNGRENERGEGAAGVEERNNGEDDGSQREGKEGQEGKEEGRGGGGGGGGGRKSRFPCRALSAQNEVAALTAAVDYLAQSRDTFPTTLEYDEVAYREARAALDAPPELLNALIYRITIKRILARHLEMADVAIALVQDIARDQLERSAENEANACNDDHCSIAHAPPSSSRLDHLLLLSSSPPPVRKPLATSTAGGGGGGGGDQRQKNHHHHRHCLTTTDSHCLAITDSLAFTSYISDLESALLLQGQHQLQQQQQQQPLS